MNLIYNKFMDPFRYVYWHYSKAPKRFFQIWGNFFSFFFYHLFPVPTLFRTLLKPWKKTGDKTASVGFDPKVVLQNLASGFVSRFVGLLVRIIVITVALATELLCLAVGLIFFFIWFFWPVTIVYSAISKNFIVLIPLAFLGIFFVYFYKLAREKIPDQMSLEEVFGQKWISIVWERLGLHINEVPKEVLKNPEEKLTAFLQEKKIKKEDFKTAFIWELSRQKNLYVQKRFWRRENLLAVTGLGKDWAYGFTPDLDNYAEPIKALEKYEHLIGRRNELEQIENILSKSKQSNVLLIGEAGVGKMSLVQKFARLSESGKLPRHLSYKRPVLLNMNRALAGLRTVGELEARLIRLFSQAKIAGNIILIIDNFHTLVNIAADVGLGKKDITEIISPFLRAGDFQLIAITTYQGLHEHIEKHGGLMNFFEKVEVKEPDPEETKEICRDSVREVESRVPVKITVQAINEIVKRSDLYITDLPFPEKALDLIEDSALYVAQKTDKDLVTPEDVDKVISIKTEIPVGELQQDEKDKLLNLEDILHKRVVNQNTAIVDISSAMRRGRLELADEKRPIGSFLFLGPTGVGKTETAKALAEAYFGSETRINRFDMSEFQGTSGVEKMIGSAATGRNGLLTTTVKENPFSLLLLDEIEKADSAVLNLFLQVLGEGWITDAFGRKVNFRNQIIIATSNAGAKLIWEKIQEDVADEYLRVKLIEHIFKEGIFRPEFFNRFDGTIIFKPLTRENLMEISGLMLNRLKERLAKKDLLFEFGDDLQEKIAKLGYDPVNGARPMRRVIQKKVEDIIAKKVLKGEIKKHSPFKISAGEIG